MPTNKLIINAALTGMVINKSDSPHIPLTPKEIAEDAGKVCELGASILHIHARDTNGKPSCDRSIYREIIERIRDNCGEDVIITVSTSGRVEKNIERRMDALTLEGDCKPDMASLTLGSMNFIREASLNAPETIRRLANEMQQRGIKPELEIFDYGMAHYAGYLQQKGIIEENAYANLLLGSLGTVPAHPKHIAGLIETLPADTIWAATGIGRFAFEMQRHAISMGGSIRVGLEDCIYMDAEKTELATNEKLVRRAIDVAETVGRKISSPVETRALLGLERSGFK
jgi:uncharacterized protein (DUF849 family)